MTHLMKLQLITIFVLTINQLAAQDPPSDDILIKEFKRFPRKDDCDAKATKATLRWLTEKDDEIIKESDPSMKLLIPSRLRAYLYRKGFLAHPGSVHFVNPQDHIIRFKCGKETDPFWRTQGTLQDTNLKKSGYINAQYIDKAPTPLLYYRRFSCSSNKCVHYFHVISRPAPRIDFPLQFQEGTDAKFGCAIHKCYYMYDEDECELFDGVEDVIPLFHPPLKFGWIFHDKSTFHNATADFTSGNKLKKLKLKKTFKSDIEISWQTMSSVEVSNDLNADVKNKIRETVVVSSQVSIKNIQKEAAGQFECIVVDRNGVPSKPLKGSGSDDKSPGITYIHVRKVYWTILPLVIIAILIVVLLMFTCCCPPHMEHDDGTPYTAEELKMSVSAKST